MSPPATSPSRHRRLWRSPRARTSGAVTFTPQDWWKLQTVTVTPEETGRSGSDYTRYIAHSVTGADYESNNVGARGVAIAVEDRFHATASLELSSNTVNEDVGSIEIVVTAVWHSEYAPTRPHVYFLSTKDFYGEHTGLRPCLQGAPAPSPITRRPTDYRKAIRIPGRGVRRGRRWNSPVHSHPEVHINHTRRRHLRTRRRYRGTARRRPGWFAQGMETEVPTTIPSYIDGLWQRLVIVDNDPSGITFPSTRLEVTEEDATGAAYTLEMVSEPAEDVFIDISGAEDSDVTVSPPTVKFTPANWDTPKTVRVTAAHDDDLVDDEVTLTHRARGPVRRRIRSRATPLRRPRPAERHDHGEGQRRGARHRQLRASNLHRRRGRRRHRQGHPQRRPGAPGGRADNRRQPGRGFQDPDYSGVPANVTFAAILHLHRNDTHDTGWRSGPCPTRNEGTISPRLHHRQRRACQPPQRWW